MCRKLECLQEIERLQDVEKDTAKQNVYRIWNGWRTLVYTRKWNGRAGEMAQPLKASLITKNIRVQFPAPMALQPRKKKERK